MKAYKIEIFVIDFDEVGHEEVKTIIENNRYPNHCISPKVKGIEIRDIGEWSDSHPLNNRLTADAEYKRIFGI